MPSNCPPDPFASPREDVNAGATGYTSVKARFVQVGDVLPRRKGNRVVKDVSYSYLSARVVINFVDGGSSLILASHAMVRVLTPRTPAGIIS